MFYIISLIHTEKDDKFITLWRPNNAGYCYAKEMAGLYEVPQPGYHDSSTNMPIQKTKADGLFLYLSYDKPNNTWFMIPNCSQVWDALGVKMTKHGLQRLPVKI